ncbi:MAG: deoxyribose-phosphate aldolase [Lachnospiraceae bacterium]|nr:deoxyribose-phosphate aldolase [Lachnospiraceae bacterium]
MKVEEILSFVDHTLLLQGSTWEDIKRICDQGMKYHTASVCIPPYYVKKARDYMGPYMPITTVIGFPNGNTTTAVKAFETKEALQNGASEIDMVINIGELKAGNYNMILNEINELKAICKDRILKVIIETCLLTEEEKIKMCEIVTGSNADFIKTSTGFSTGGAAFDDVALFKKHLGPQKKIKAAGGISSLEDAERFIELGASRLGTSRIVKIAEEMQGK